MRERDCESHIFSFKRLHESLESTYHRACFERGCGSVMSCVMATTTVRTRVLFGQFKGRRKGEVVVVVVVVVAVVAVAVAVAVVVVKGLVERWTKRLRIEPWTRFTHALAATTAVALASSTAAEAAESATAAFAAVAVAAVAAVAAVVVVATTTMLKRSGNWLLESE